jgi:hypothetical protein
MDMHHQDQLYTATERFIELCSTMNAAEAEERLVPILSDLLAHDGLSTGGSPLPTTISLGSGVFHGEEET